MFTSAHTTGTMFKLAHAKGMTLTPLRILLKTTEVLPLCMETEYGETLFRSHF